MLVAAKPARPLRPVWPVVQARISRTPALIFRPAFAISAGVMALTGILLGLVIGSHASQPVTNERSASWYAAGSSIAGEGAGALPDVYAIPTPTTRATGERSTSR